MKSLRAFKWIPTSSRTFKSIALLLVVTEAALLVPLRAAPQDGRVAAADARPSSSPLPAPKVKVNRTVPRVAPPPELPVFSSSPTDEEIFRARTFMEPLLPVGPTNADQNRALSSAILTYVTKGVADDVSPFEAFVSAHRSSAWRASILANVATVYRKTGRPTRALDTFNAAWNLAKEAPMPGRAVADYAMGESLEMLANLGQAHMIEAQLKLLGDRTLRGPAGAKRNMALFTLSQLQQHPDRVIPSGPKALERIALTIPGGMRSRTPIGTYRPTAAGMSLRQLGEMASAVGLPGILAARVSDVPPVVPSIVHLRLGHFSAVVREDLERQRYLIEDPALGGPVWMTAAALAEEMSGFVFLPRKELPAGWRLATNQETEGIIGRSCPPGGPGPEAPCDGDDCPGSPPPSSPGEDEDSESGNEPDPCTGLATYRFHPVTAALVITDTPVGHRPAIGPTVRLDVVYNSRDLVRPQTFAFSNIGPNWSFGWLSYAQEILAACGTFSTGCVPEHVFIVLRGSGAETYSGPPDANGAYATHYRKRATLVRTSTTPIRYERRLPDGTVEVFALADGAPAGQRRVFLTQIIDPQGHSLQLTYDSQFRLVSIADTLGQVTTLSYGLASDPLKVTQVTDPFSRSAYLSYNAAGQLTSITDVIGMVSSFLYGPDDVIVSMTTPYGTTTFRHESNTVNAFTNPTVEATDPLGATERLEFRWDSTLPETEPTSVVPTGFSAFNVNLDRYVTLYWNKRAWAQYPEDASKAVQTHWMLQGEFPNLDLLRSVPVPHSIKRPLENRVWYAYPNQPWPDYAGTHTSPTVVARVLDDGTTQTWQATYNAQGSVLTRTDPLGRRKSYAYASNGVDLLEVRQTTDTLNDLVGSFANYVNHRPQTLTDPAGQVTTITYNAAGQVMTVTNAKSETTTSTYDAVTHQLLSVTGAVTGSTTTYTYDGYGRVRTVTNPDGYVVTTDYDALNRRIRLSYPDGTYEETTYERLDVVSTRDRLGRLTRLFYDPLGRVVSSRDPLGRTIRQEWCACGALDGVVDANGNRTKWERDAQGRIVREIRANNSDVEYVYETTTSRLKRRTDATGQHTDYAYFVDDRLQQVSYPNATIPTATVTLGYDSTYGRMSSMSDGVGTTTRTYHVPGVLGAGSVATADGPLANDAIAYTYDQLGRMTGRVLNSVSVTRTFDALGRSATEVTELGTFTFTYDGTSGRVATVTYPNGQVSEYAYFGNTGNRRLQTIHHKYPNATTLSKFDYTYDVVGNIATWRQQADATAVLWEYGYDAADQLTRAVKKSTGPTPTVLKRHGYGYDPGGNRTTEQVDDAVTTSAYNNLNELMTRQPGGILRFAGTVTEAATVTVNGKPAAVASDNTFVAQVPVAAGASAVTIAATDPSGNSASAIYDLEQTGSTNTLTYDANGNLATSGTKTFEWNARNQLVRVLDGAVEVATFVYDGFGRRVQKSSGGVTRTYVYDGEEVVEERVAGGSVVRHLHGPAIDEPLAVVDGGTGAATYYVTDHLGSVTQATSAAGLVTLARQYDPFGVPIAGAAQSGYAFTGREWDAELGLYYYRARYYAPELGRFLNPDPSGMVDGPNLYSYVGGRPTVARDPSGRVIIIVIAGVAYALSAAEAAYLFTLATLLGLTIAEAITKVIQSRSEGESERNPAQDKRLTKGEIDILKEHGIDPEDLKGGPRTSDRDLFKDKKGDIYVKPKDGSGEGEPTGVNIKDLCKK